MNAVMENTGQENISFEARRLEAVAATYPPEMQEPFIWLANWIHTECARNLKSAEHKLKGLGLTTTASTLSKILRGRWRLNADGQLCTPIMALEKFIEMMDLVRLDPALAAMSSAVNFIETPTYELIRNHVDIRREPGSVCRMGMVVGPTGAQKTESFKFICSRNPRSCKLVDCPENGSLGKFIAKWTRVYNASEHLSVRLMRRKIVENCGANKCVIFDNAQRLYIQPRHSEMITLSQPVFSFIQSVLDETGVTVILSITPEFYSRFLSGMAAGYFEQFEGRIGGRDEILVLPAFTPQEDVIQIAESFKLPDAAAHADYLEKLARLPGRVRKLFWTLQTAKREADFDKQPLTIAHVKAVMPEARLKELLAATQPGQGV